MDRAMDAGMNGMVHRGDERTALRGGVVVDAHVHELVVRFESLVAVAADGRLAFAPQLDARVREVFEAHAVDVRQLLLYRIDDTADDAPCTTAPPCSGYARTFSRGRCVHCRREFGSRRRRPPRFCSMRCRRRFRTDVRRVVTQPTRAKRCVHCGVAFIGRRSDAITCSGRCRTAASRARTRQPR